MSFDLSKLKGEMPYKWRVQSFSKWKPEASCVAYIDSRQVQELLDEVVGPENWQDKYYEVKGNLFCSIGIRVKGLWRFKSDCGTESNVDKQKGEASDAFKRAAVKWGIGRFLYSMKFVKLPASAKKEGNNYPHIVDSSGKQVWDITAHINIKFPPKPKKERVLTGPDVELEWNGEVHNFVMIGHERIDISKDTLKKLKAHQKYKEPT